jgi:hypothetical protein
MPAEDSIRRGSAQIEMNKRSGMIASLESFILVAGPVIELIYTGLKRAARD